MTPIVWTRADQELLASLTSVDENVKKLNDTVEDLIARMNVLEGAG